MRIKKLSVLIFFIIIAIGVSGCMDNGRSSKNDKIEKMTLYAEEKYSKDFSVEYFYDAPDSTYMNILTLSDGEHIFNVYNYDDENEITDDYPHVVANKKLTEYLSETNQLSSKDIDIYSRIMLQGNILSDFEYIFKSDINTLVENTDVFKVIVVIRVSGYIEEFKEDLFAVYKEVLNINSEYIEFNVISCNEMDNKLEKNLTNMMAYYGNDWDKYSEIKSFITVTDKNITSAETLVSEVN